MSDQVSGIDFLADSTCPQDSTRFTATTFTVDVTYSGSSSRSDIAPTRTSVGTLTGSASFTWSRQPYSSELTAGQFSALSNCCQTPPTISTFDPADADDAATIVCVVTSAVGSPTTTTTPIDVGCSLVFLGSDPYTILLTFTGANQNPAPVVCGLSTAAMFEADDVALDDLDGEHDFTATVDASDGYSGRYTVTATLTIS